MSVPWDARRENLTRLSQELEAHAQKLQVPFETSPLAAKLSSGLYLAHSTSDRKFAEICATQAIVSRARQALRGGWEVPPDCDEFVLGTCNDVFFYAAPFRYPNTGCGLLFARTLEVEYKEAGVATPFDSGGLRRHMTRREPAEPVQAFLARHEMPVPEYRQYLGQVMTTLFGDPKEYIEGEAPCHPNPLGLHGGDHRQWTHEVRIPERVHVQGSAHLQAVFAPRARVAANRSVEALFAWCQREKVDMIFLETPKGDDFQALQRACLSYIHQRLY